MTTSLFWCSKFNEGFAMSENPGTKTLASPYLALWSLLALYAAARFLPLVADKVPVSVIAALYIFPPLLFALLHGASLLGRRAILTFFLLFLVVGNLVLLLGTPPGGLAAVSDPSGAMWNIRDILGASALVSIFTMGAFVLFAWLRLAEQNKETPSP